MRSLDENFNILNEMELKDAKEAQEKFMEEFLKPEVREIHVTKKLPFYAQDKKNDWVKGDK